jgi:integrase/recombinase XerD
MKNTLSNYLNYFHIEKYASPLSIYSYRLELEKFISYLQSNNINNFSSCTISSVREYIYYSKDSRDLSTNSVGRLIAVLKSFFNYLFEEDLITQNPTRKIHLPKKISPIPKVISKFEVDMILAAIKHSPIRCRRNYLRDKLVISMLYYTGIRRSELLSLNWNDINLGKSTLAVRSGKGRKDRIIPIHPKLLQSLDLYLAQRLPMDNYALFIGEQGKRLSKASFSNILKMYLGLSGLNSKKYTAHSFRHSFASSLVEAGVDIFTVQKLMGHSSLDATRIYISVSTRNLASAVQCL